jgi:DNA-binding NtrC family response regulator
MNSVMVIDDEPQIRDLLTIALSMRRYPVLASPDRENALIMLQGGVTADCILMDYNMPGMSAANFLQQLKDRAIRIPVVLMTATPDVESLAHRLGLTKWVQKPLEFDKLYDTIDGCTEKCALPVSPV